MPADLIETWADVGSSMAVWDSGGHEQDVAGVRTWKVVDDLARYRLAVRAGRPEVVVETGTKWGGSALWFAGLGLDVVTVDVDREPSAPARRLSDRVTWLAGDSAHPKTVAAVARLVAGRRTMVSLDSDHHAGHVRAEIEAYAPLVSPGCHLVVEDGIADLAGQAGRIIGGRIPELGGPLVAVRETVATWPGWTRDADIERITSVTHHPAGWWRRDA